MSVQQYDGIGEAFEGFKSLPLMRYGEVPSFLGMVGDVSGRSVLDLACGTGFYSREFRRLLFAPGEYELRVLYDTNGNGVWDSGRFFGKHLQPEKVIPIKKKLNVKANWDNDIDITL